MVAVAGCPGLRLCFIVSCIGLRVRVSYAHKESTWISTVRAVPYDPSAPKKPTNVSVNSDLLAQAKALNINLWQTLEQRLEELVREGCRQAWLRENQAAVEDYNRRVEATGVFSDGLRRF